MAKYNLQVPATIIINIEFEADDAEHAEELAADIEIDHLVYESLKGLAAERHGGFQAHIGFAGRDAVRWTEQEIEEEKRG